MKSKVVNLFRYDVFEYFWGSAVQESLTGKWIKAFLKPDGFEIDLECREVEVHENGIEFL